MAYHEHCILVQQKLDILAAFTNSVLHQSVWSEFSDIQTTLPGHQCCGHFNSICMPMSQFSISVWCNGLLGYGGVAPMHIWLLEVAKLFCVFIFFVPTWEIVWSDLHTSISPAYCSLVSCPAGKIGGKICLITLHTILDTCSYFHTFRQEFERTNRNATFFNHCNSEDGKCELHVLSFTILASVWLQLRQLMPWLHSTEVE